MSGVDFCCWRSFKSVQLMADLRQRVLDGLRWTINASLIDDDCRGPNVNDEGGTLRSSCYGSATLYEHGMKVLTQKMRHRKIAE